ncbi:putative iS encoded protein, partial [Escherichia coli 96.0109]
MSGDSGGQSSHLHNQRHRVAEQRNPACHQKTQGVP